MADPTPQADPNEQFPGIAVEPAQGLPGAAASIGKLDPVPPEVRQSYAAAAGAGHTLGPQDFHDAYHGAGHPPIKGLAQQLPSFDDVIDGALGLAQQNSLPLDPGLLTQTRQNLLDHYAETGKPLSVTLQEAKSSPDLADRLTRTPPPPNAPIASLIHQLEGSSDNAVSPKGAVGRNQIMPDTARQYGFDPGRLKDPAYNQQVANAIQDDLMRRYHGDTQAVLVAYNAGPGMADKWLAAGRDMKVLPDETQKYLRHASQLGAGAPEGGTFDPMGMIAGTGAGFSLPNLAQLLGMPSFEQQVEQHQAKLDEMEKEGVPAAERMAYDAQNNPFANVLGASTLTGFVSQSLMDMFRTPAERAEAALSAESRAFNEANIRRERGGAERAAQVASAALEGFRTKVNAHLPEYEQWLRSGQAKTHFGGPKPVIQQLVDYVEGLPGPAAAQGSEFHQLAVSLRALYQKVRGDIENEIPDMASFVEDYYRHLWEKPHQAAQVFGAGRLGSSASLQGRTIPTVAEGIMHGLIPRILDPIDNTLHYIAGMRNFLAQHRVFQLGIDNGYIKFAPGGVAPQPGWQPLKGRFATRALPGSNSGQVERAFAPAGFASSYNSWVGAGFYEWPKLGATYAKLQFANNMMTGMKLALSGYHAWNIVQETAVAGFAHSLGELAHGELARGLRDMGLSVTVLPKLAQSYLRGSRLQQQYLMLKDYGPEMDKLADLFTKAGGRAEGRGAEYLIGDAPNWFKAWRRGSLAMELKHGAARTIGDASETGIKRGALLLPRVGAYFAHEMGRIMNSATAPLFDHVIPKVKMASWADEMSMWLRHNPLATEEQQLQQARALANSMDDRFGEMVQDNLFWPRLTKQILNLDTISVGWEYGTLRAFGGAAKDILNGNVLSTRARWLLAFPAIMGISSAAYQYFKTGSTPQESPTPVRDLLAPRTGGQTPEGVPERAILPGYEKDPLQWFNVLSNAPDLIGAGQGVAAVAENKLSPMWQIARGFVTGKDWAGNDIRSRVPDQATGEVPPGWKSYMDYVWKEVAPISASQPRLRGTNIGPVEKATGIRLAPAFITDPDRVERAIRGHERKMEREEMIRTRRQQSREEP